MRARDSQNGPPALGDGRGSAWTFDFKVAGIPQFAGTNTTGAASALLGANCPATTPSAPYTWIQVKTADGSTAYIPVWK